MTVTATDRETGATRSTVTAGDGTYSLDLLEGTYDVVFSRFGYDDRVEEGVVIVAQQETELNVGLQPTPTATVSGTVTGSDTASPWPPR